MRLTLRNLTKSCCANRSLSSRPEPIRFLARVGKTKQPRGQTAKGIETKREGTLVCPEKTYDLENVITSTKFPR